LALRKVEIIQRLNELLGEELIRDIQFQVVSQERT
jgi:hypothetical protein